MLIMTATQLTRYGYADLEPLMALMTGDEKHGPAATSPLMSGAQSGGDR